MPRGSFAKRVYVRNEKGDLVAIEQRVSRKEAYATGMVVRRPRRCTNCGALGHDRRTCHLDFQRADS